MYPIICDGQENLQNYAVFEDIFLDNIQWLSDYAAYSII
jgi:hypothetical protein